MPELPEVEVTRRSLLGRLEGARIVAVHLGKPLRWPLGIDAEELHGWEVVEVARRGKYIWLALRGAAGQHGGLLIHLGMSGSLGLLGKAPPAGVHDHFDLVTTRGVLRLNDPRRFGAVVFGESMLAGLPGKLLENLGLEPFDEALTGEYLHARLKGRSVSIKQALLAGDIVVGAGNIYACEALFRAGVDPRLPAGKLSKPRCTRLIQEVRAVLGEAMDKGGSSLRNFKDAHGTFGHFQLTTFVYGREGEPCRVCANPVRRIIQGQRSTFYCPICQKK